MQLVKSNLIRIILKQQLCAKFLIQKSQFTSNHVKEGAKNKSKIQLKKTIINPHVKTNLDNPGFKPIRKHLP